MGRIIGPADDTPGCSAPGVVISHSFWTREYGRSPTVLGETILLDGHRFDIIGVTPEYFFGVEVGRSFDVALPLCSEPIFRGANSSLDAPETWFLAAMGRLQPDWSLERARAQLRAISPGIFEATLPPRYVTRDVQSYLAFQLDATPAGTGVSTLRRMYSNPLWILLGVSALVLLIACANLANLMLARATARTREISVRLAIGASRRRVVRQLLSESLLLAGLGAGVGLILARWLSSFLLAFLSTDSAPLYLDLAFDWRIFAFTAIVAATTCLLFGLVPALRVTVGASTAAGLGSRGTSGGRQHFTLRSALVVLQVALSLVLLVGGLLFGLSLRNLTALDPGFRQAGVLVVNLDLRRSGISSQARRPLFNQIVEKVTGIPGIVGVAEATIAPMSGNRWNNSIVVDGTVQPGNVNFNSVGPGYFDTLGTAMVAGRDFDDSDRLGSAPVAIVNQLFVRTYLKSHSALGSTFYIERAPGGESNPVYEIVGVVADTNYGDLREDLPPIAYLAALQEAENDPFLQLVVYSGMGAGPATSAITQTIREVNPSITLQFQAMDRLFTDSLKSERLMAGLSGFFALLAVLIATVGLYGVMSYVVVQRRMEIGIRMALGAERRTVVRMVVGDAGRLLVMGLLVGTVLSVIGARSAETLLYGLKPWDPFTLALAATLLGVVALLASWLPARRAARVSPTLALRADG